MATDKPRYSITLDEELLEKVENFRFVKRYSTRTQATVELIRLGIKKSEESSLTVDDEATKKEKNLLEMFWKLDEESQREVINFVDYRISRNKTTPPQ